MQDLEDIENHQESGSFPLWPLCPSPIRLANWSQFLRSHPDKKFSLYIERGFQEGFRVGFNRPSVVLKSAAKNHGSALDNPSVVSDRIKSEQALGRLVGPVHSSFTHHIHTSPIGLVPKKGQCNQWRMIVDLSYPSDHSVNDGISRELSTLSYASVDDAIMRILALGQGTKLIKIDLKDAYRIIPVHPTDVHLLGISWQGATYVDRALPFGLRSAPKIFTAVSDMIAWALHCQGLHDQIHYLDDFLFLVHPSSDQGEAVLSTVLRTLDYLGVPVSPHKVEGPSTALVFLGILIDTEALELRLPLPKLKSTKDLVQRWQKRKACTRRELESLLGHLVHAATVIRHGRTFLKALFTLLHRVKRPHHFIRITAGARADLCWWACFLQHWNGSSFFPRSLPSVHVFTDASTSFGCGGFVQSLGWFFFPWPEAEPSASISLLELVPVVVATAVWG